MSSTSSAAAISASLHASDPPINNTNVAFALDDRMMLVCCGRAIRLIATKTGQRLGLLQAHTDEVTAVAVTSRVQAISSSADGSIRVWNFCIGECERVLTVGEPLIHMTVSKDSSTALVASKTAVYSVDIASGAVSQLFETDSASCLAVSPDQTILACTSDSKLLLYRFSNGSLVKHRHRRLLRSVCFHPTEPYLATSDCTGRIVLFYRFLEAKPVVSTLHWHAHSLSAITFSDDGAYLLSGGQEAVLVLWQMETGHKHFLPRLGAPITSISLSHSANLYALTCVDNSVRLVDAVATKLKATIRGLCCSSSESNVVADPLRPRSVVLNGHASGLQFYNVDKDAHHCRVDAAPRNLVQGFDAVIESFAVSRDGAWLALLLQRLTGSELQFWSYTNRVMKYELCTRVDEPHAGVLAFSPCGNVLVSSGDGDSFRLWKQVERPKLVRMTPAPADTPTRSWRCQAAGSYRGLKCGNAVAFSGDGSLLAVVFERLVTLWDPDTLQTRRVIPMQQPVCRMAFCGDFLLLSSKTRLSVYNLLAASIWWTFDEATIGLAVSPCSSYFAALSRQSLLLFQPSSPSPLLETRIEHNITVSEKANPLSFTTTKAGDLSLVVLKAKARQFVRVDLHFGKCTNASAATAAIPQISDKDISPLVRLYGGAKALEPGPEVKVRTTAKPSHSVESLFDGASHVMPPLPALYMAFMQRIIGKNPEFGDHTAEEPSVETMDKQVADEASPKGLDALSEVKLSPEVFFEVAAKLQSPEVEVVDLELPKRRSRKRKSKTAATPEHHNARFHTIPTAAN